MTITQTHQVSAVAMSVTPRNALAVQSPAGATLALLPALYGVSLLAPVAGLAWDPITYATVGLAFYFLSVALAAIDERRLRRLGVNGATAYWSLLGTLPYLVARTRVLADADRPGLGLLWLAIGTSLATISGLAVVSAF